MEANGLFGRPWKVAGRFDTFEAADRKRKQLYSEKNLQVKVKKQLKGFVVKTRSTVVQPQVEEHRSRKKQPQEGDSVPMSWIHVCLNLKNHSTEGLFVGRNLAGLRRSLSWCRGDFHKGVKHLRDTEAIDCASKENRSL